MNELSCWRPSAPIVNLLQRAKIVSEIRQFFSERGLLEVETPAMSQATVTDIHLFSFQTHFVSPGATTGMLLYLMTSPEYHMKRLLAAGSGPIFQLFRSFRNEESGCYHNPEFTMLEWYRPNYDMHGLMHEVDEFLQKMLNCDSAEMISYQQVFSFYVGIDPLLEDQDELLNAVVKWEKIEELRDSTWVNEDRDTLLQLLFSMVVQPNIGSVKPVFVYNFPASQALLAKRSIEDHRVGDRFEVYFKGIELANGCCELINVDEQRKHFLEENRKRMKLDLRQLPIDERLLGALEHGVPECSGVALGVDRLVMLALQAESLNDVIAFPVARA